MLRALLDALLRGLRRRGALLPIALCLIPAIALAEAAPQREDRIKAALIFKLVKFVDWPSSALEGKAPLQICALGDSGVAQALAAVDGKPARDRVARFRRIASLAGDDTEGCHVLYIPAGALGADAGIPGALQGSSVLTIGDAPDFARHGGIIGLVHGENKVAFEINVRVARDSSLVTAAPLLELATVIE
jgi:hypothetical protein